MTPGTLNVEPTQWGPTKGTICMGTGAQNNRPILTSKRGGNGLHCDCSIARSTEPPAQTHPQFWGGSIDSCPPPPPPPPLTVHMPKRCCLGPMTSSSCIPQGGCMA